MSEPLEISFDLKKPCPECPFRRDAPKHIGILKELPLHHKALEEGLFLHTCHRTDPRSDYAGAKDYKGKLQHCAGALALQINAGTAKKNRALCLMLVRSGGGKALRKFDQRKKDPSVFSSFKEMCRHYSKMFGLWGKNEAEMKDALLVHINTSKPEDFQ